MTYKEALMRQITEEEQGYIECSLGFVPRHGKPARRERDCKVDCNNYEECEKQRIKAVWKEHK